MNPQQVIKTLKAEEERKRRKFEREQQKFIKEMEKNEVMAERKLMPKLEYATAYEYMEWLRGFIEGGGKPTHYYDYPMNRWDFYVAKNDIEIIPLHGANSINIIVPSDVKCTFDEIGHNTIFFMKDFSHKGHCVPVFNDTQF